MARYTAAVEGGEAWVVNYAIELDENWATRAAHVSGQSAAGSHELVIEADGGGTWELNGDAAPHLEECGVRG